jgi:hypothetical protein
METETKQLNQTISIEQEDIYEIIDYRSMGVKGARKPLPLGMGMKCRPFFR